MIRAADFGCRTDLAALHDGNARIPWNFVEEDVAADPSGAAGGWRERRGAPAGGKGERRMGEEKFGAKSPGGGGAGQDEREGGAGFKAGGASFGVSGGRGF